MINAMKRYILLFAAILFTFHAFSQSVTIKFKNGNTTVYDMSEIQSILFGEGNSGSEDSKSLVGTWEVVYREGWGQSYNSDSDKEYIQFYKDGTYFRVIDDEDGIYTATGTWTETDTDINLHEKSGDLKGSTFTYKILNRESNKITVSMMGITAYLQRVSDSVISKYKQ